MKNSETVPKVYEIFAMGLGKIGAAMATPPTTFNEGAFRAALRRCFYNKESNKPKQFPKSKPEIPRNSKEYDFFKGEAKKLGKDKCKRKSPPNDDDETDGEGKVKPPRAKKAKAGKTLEESQPNEPEDNTVATQSIDDAQSRGIDSPAIDELPGPQSSNNEKDEVAIEAANDEKRMSTADESSANSSGVNEASPNSSGVNEASANSPSSPNEILKNFNKTVKEEAMNEIGDVLIRPNSGIDDCNDVAKTYIFTELHRFVNFAAQGGLCSDYEGWFVEQTARNMIKMVVSAAEENNIPFSSLEFEIPERFPMVKHFDDEVATSQTGKGDGCDKDEAGEEQREAEDDDDEEEAEEQAEKGDDEAEVESGDVEDGAAEGSDTAEENEQ